MCNSQFGTYAAGGEGFSSSTAGTAGVAGVAEALVLLGLSLLKTLLILLTYLPRLRRLSTSLEPSDGPGAAGVDMAAGELLEWGVGMAVFALESGRGGRYVEGGGGRGHWSDMQNWAVVIGGG